ncbi:MAG: hypothetical protein ACXW4B_06085 [Micavibrio sp.]
MKKSFAVAAALATALFSTAASAEEVSFQGCTADGKTATLVADVEGTVGDKSLKTVVADAFKAAVKELDGAAVPTEKGFVVFVEKLQQALAKQELSKDATFGIAAAPTVGAPACKP